MNSLPVVSPPYGAPTCWGQDYRDGDIECSQCRFKDTCQKEVLRGSMNSPYPPLPTQGNVPFPRAQQPVPMPVPSPYRPPAQPVQVQVHPVTSYQQPRPVSIPVQPSYPHYQPQMMVPQQAHYPPQLPGQMPDPMIPWSRPGAMAPPYYFNQYPEETHGQRLLKNLVLRGLSAIMYELFSYVSQWTWPPRRDNNFRD